MAQDGPVGVVTGASGGLAAAICRRLVGDGWRLVLMSRRGAPELSEELGQPGFAGSVLSDADVDGAVALALDRFGRLDGAVASGGRYSDQMQDFDIPAPPPATGAALGFDPDYAREPFDIPFTAWAGNYDMNVLGPMRLFRAALPAFRSSGGGAFVAMSGIEALQPRVPFVLGPNRMALHGFVKLLSDRYGGEGIRANCIVPGLMENAADEFAPGWVDQVPLGRYGAVGEAAGAVAFLLSPDAGYVTGQALVADGGLNRSAGL